MVCMAVDGHDCTFLYAWIYYVFQTK